MDVGVSAYGRWKSCIVPEIFLIIRFRVVSLFPTAEGGKWGKSDVVFNRYFEDGETVCRI